MKSVKTKQRKWLVPSNTPQTVDDLTFTSRDSEGRICWWDVTPPKTDYFPVFEKLGRAYAFELLDLIHNPEKKEQIALETFGFISAEITRQGVTMNDGLYFGFFGAISEFLIAGECNR